MINSQTVFFSFQNMRNSSPPFLFIQFGLSQVNNKSRNLLWIAGEGFVAKVGVYQEPALKRISYFKMDQGDKNYNKQLKLIFVLSSWYPKTWMKTGKFVITHCTMGKLQWGDGIRNFSLLSEIMTILRRNVTFTF